MHLRRPDLFKPRESANDNDLVTLRRKLDKLEAAGSGQRGRERIRRPRRLKAAAPRARSAKPKPRGRKKVRKVRVNLKSWTVSIDDAFYTLDSEQAVRWIKVLAANRGVLISSGGLAKYDPELIDPRTDRIRKKLPEPVTALLETVPKKGTRMRLA